MIDNLIDRVSKNGYLLLNVGPKPDGTIPEGAKEVLIEMGAWLEINGEAIYKTTPWFIAGEGPTKVSEIQNQGFNESGAVYTQEDIRFTVNGDNLYATFLDWPGDKALIASIRATGLEAKNAVIPDWAKGKEVKSLVGTEWFIKGEDDEDDDEDDDVEASHYMFKEDGELFIKGGEAGDGIDVDYLQIGEEVIMSYEGVFTWSGTYDGNQFKVSDDISGNYPGFYKEEIKRITMLGSDEELEWAFTGQGLMIKTPKKQGKYAYSFKIERYHHPKLD